MKKFTKIGMAPIPFVRMGCNMDEYNQSKIDSLYSSSDDHLSPPINYWVAGYATNFMIGGFIAMCPYIQNGDKKDGLFRSSRIVDIVTNLNKIVEIHTKNSIYLVEDYNETI